MISIQIHFLFSPLSVPLLGGESSVRWLLVMKNNVCKVNDRAIKRRQVHPIGVRSASRSTGPEFIVCCLRDPKSNYVRIILIYRILSDAAAGKLGLGRRESRRRSTSGLMSFHPTKMFRRKFNFNVNFPHARQLLPLSAAFSFCFILLISFLFCSSAALNPSTPALHSSFRKYGMTIAPLGLLALAFQIT